MSSSFKFGVLTALIMSFAMSLFFSGLFTFLALGGAPDFLSAWAGSFAIGWPLGFVLAMLIGKPVRAIAQRLAGLPAPV
ncbi:DUF2798 domain-containing protein [Rhizobium wuzhouense]|nr:DUF2798 domain-containing protein [Rhizobium wuzhouense]